MKKIFFTAFFFSLILTVTANNFTESDRLRGHWSLERFAYKVHFYDLAFELFPDEKRISGQNTIHFTLTEETEKIQLDLVPEINITNIFWEETGLHFERNERAVFVLLPENMQLNKRYKITVFFEGQPPEAINPPWQGGLVWSEDKYENPWIGVAVQSDGASMWWPVKDHFNEKADSVRISCTLPDSLDCISNGQFLKKQQLENNRKRFEWLISYPVVPYNVTFYAGKYHFFTDEFNSVNNKKVDLNYYVLPHNSELAQKYFKQVAFTLDCFEQFFGPYPFPRDGYKLVEAPYAGMEHQSGIAYGNQFKKGYLGYDLTGSNLELDYIIVHETAHEWWGNFITAKDIADIWIHEALATYAEILYVECYFSEEAVKKFLQQKRQGIRNDRPIRGTPGYFDKGSQDMYTKGAMIIHTLRSAIDNDSIFFEIFNSLTDKFAYGHIDTDSFIGTINQTTQNDWSDFFDFYIHGTKLPVLEFKKTSRRRNVTIQYRWSNENAKLNFPVKVKLDGKNYAFIQPTDNWQEIKITRAEFKEFKVDTNNFLIELNKRN